MATLPGMLGEVYFGDPEKPLPDWRTHADQQDDDEDDRELTPEERKALVAILGFDPEREEP